MELHFKVIIGSGKLTERREKMKLYSRKKGENFLSQEWVS